MEEDEIYKKARKRIKAKKGFFVHLLTYVCILAMLYAIMYFEGGSFLPVIVVGLCWGIGVGAHYLGTFGTQHLEFLGFDPNWEEEELEREVERLSRKRELKERMQEEQDYLDLDESERLELREIERQRLEDDLDDGQGY